ncbi:MAG: transposase [Candidatus Sungbacteria bacterium]|uniref:Transposase n=1 Tax=Candidatus Sungiibacteriota bacterium TaxID=2750080 RepID=A0A9D6LP12_9BACT|nr:transposase [Candidatus Sungbacteria bacterium]
MRTDKIHRLASHDYTTNGYYFVTIISRFRKPIFPNHEITIERILQETVTAIPGATIDTFIAMPNHVHMIIQLENCTMLLGEIIRRFKAKVSQHFGRTVWQSNYYEHIIRDEQALNKIREYIMLNPEIARLRVEAGNYKRKVT